MIEEAEQLEVQMKDAAKLHGHLGPFLVIGVRMGKAARQILNSEKQQNGKMLAFVEVPLRTPFSCTLDGIQSTTHCTIGNQRLRVEKSLRRIVARFEIADSHKILTLTVNPDVVKEVIEAISKGATNEALAETIASTPENHLLRFKVTEKRR